MAFYRKNRNENNNTKSYCTINDLISNFNIKIIRKEKLNYI
jgi:hypothetical protein